MSIIIFRIPLIKDHLVYGQVPMSGLAYIDILHHLAGESLGPDYGKHCLKRLTISDPMTVREDMPVKLEVAFDKLLKQRRVKTWQYAGDSKKQ